MKLGKLALVFVLLSTSICNCVLAQSNVNEEQGLKPYDSVNGGDLDSVSLTSGGLALHIPLGCFPQRGSLGLCFFVRYSSKQWQVRTQCSFNPFRPQCGTPSWQPAPNSGTQVVSNLDWWKQYTSGIDDPGLDWQLGATSPDGNTHQFGIVVGGAGPVFPLRSLDATGLLFLDANTLILPNGTRLSYVNGKGSAKVGGVQPSTVTDANGNQITISASGWTDTMGRVIPGSATGSLQVQPGVATSDLSTCPSGTVTAQVWNVPGIADVNNGIRTFKFCYSNVSVSTNFNPGTAPTDYSGSMSLLTAVVRPDGSMWTMAYDNYADVTRVGFPTGGSISYTYVMGAPTCQTGTTKSMAVATRSVDANDGVGAHTWEYTYNLGYTGGSTKVTSPDGNDTVHAIGVPVTGGCNLYETQVQYYQGAAGSGSLLKTITVQYSGNLSTGQTMDGTNIEINVVPTQATVALPGGHTSKIINTYDATVTNSYGDPVMVGSVLQKDEYDYSNTLVRSTLDHYLWQDNASYKNNNFVALPVSGTTKDASGNQIAQTTYGIDQYGASGKPTPSGISTSSLVAPPAGEPIRGNVTTVSRWLDTTNSFISSTNTYFDTGKKATSTDPNGNTTSFSYSGNFLGAYVTQTNMPDTKMPDAGAPIVHHIISGDYDFNTGLLTSFTDENSQTYTYQYDNMLRLTQANHPDGGQTKFLYPDPNTVERQRLITGSTYDDYKVKFDGLGRTIQTQQLTPDCVSDIKVDTVYDALGRRASVSNPYCLTSEPTYGITQTQYDALNRTIKTIKQDGSASAVQYNAPAADGAGSSVVCTTTKDEAGKPRQTCTDSLGRLVKVIEPNPSSTATNASGWVAVSGSEQTANSQPATSGSATVTISGTENSAVVDPCTDNGDPKPCPHTVWDTGTVSITVGNFPTKTVGYGHFDTAATVAWALSCAFHNDTSSAADAYCPASAGSSTQVVLTARATGTLSNYSFTTSSATSDTTCTNFCGPSFFAAPASGAFSGGQNA